VAAGVRLGSVIGAGVLVLFGAVWYVLAVLSIAAGTALLLCLFLGVVILAGLAVAVLRLARKVRAETPLVAATEAQRAERARVSITFGVVNAVQWLLAFGVVVLANVLGIPDRIAALIEIIVGLHFIPLARLFSVRLYYVTAVAMVLAGIASFAVRGTAGAALAAGSASLVLWATAACILIAVGTRGPVDVLHK